MLASARRWTWRPAPLQRVRSIVDHVVVLWLEVGGKPARCSSRSLRVATVNLMPREYPHAGINVAKVRVSSESAKVHLLYLESATGEVR
jgi:hypothetical protein